MLDEIKQRIETINSRNGYAIFPRMVVVIDEAGEIHKQPERTVAVIDEGSQVGVMINAHEYCRRALQASVCDVLSGLEIAISDQVITVQTPPDDDSGTPDTA